MTREQLCDAIEKLRPLEANWDSYGAYSIHPLAISLAKEIVANISTPPDSAGPCNAGTVILSWGDENVTAEVRADGKLDLMLSLDGSDVATLEKLLAIYKDAPHDRR